MSIKLKNKKTIESRNPPIHIDLKFVEKYNQYASQQQTKNNLNKNEKVFFTRMADLFLFSAIHGFKNNLKKSLSESKKKKDIFKWSNLKENDIVLIKSICLLDLNKKHDIGPDIINSKSNMVSLIEEYANGGFDDFMNSFEGSTDIEGNLMDLLVTEFEK